MSTQVHQFFSTIPAMKFVFKSGAVANFIAHKYRTIRKTEIEELNAEVEAGNPNIYIKTGESLVESLQDDPMANLKKRIINEFLAEQAKLTASAVDSNKDFGNSGSEGVKAANSNQVAGNAKASNVKDSVAAMTAGIPVATVKSK